MKNIWIVAVLSSLFLWQVCVAQDITLQVAVIAQQAPGEVLMQEEEGIQSIEFKRNQPDGKYWGKVPKPKPGVLADAKKLSINYRLVASWEDVKEQLFLKIHSQLPEQITLKLYHNQNMFDDVALSNIDRLGTDRESLIEKYCRARAFHLKWRLEKRLPKHYLALRSARIWFDAATALATKYSSLFQMDGDVVKIMDDYEARAREDSKFNSRYRRYASSKYVQGMLDEVKTAEYAFVGLVPKLVAEGKHQEAYDLNLKAYNVLSAQPESTRKLVEKHQGVNLELLRGNAAFLGMNMGD